MIKVDKIQIPELPTKKPRRSYVYTPKDYEKTQERYPVLYMFDGHNVFYNSHATYGRSWGMKQYLEKTKLPLIVAAVECNPEGNERIKEYSPWDIDAPRLGLLEGKGRVTMEWFTKIFKPMIDAEYRTLPDREHTMIAGSSMGGLMALYAAVEYNEVYSRAAALSPSLWVNPVGMKKLIGSKELADPTLVYMDLGSGEVGKHTEAYRAMFETAKALSRKGALSDARIVPGAMHCEEFWEKRIPVFFDYLLG